jgi:hypothetical protein
MAAFYQNVHAMAVTDQRAAATLWRRTVEF